jgi:uncharacterized protein (DUF2062 family)
MRLRFNILVSKITALFKQGLTARELTESIVAAGIISIIPILGISTFMITTLSLKRKLNLPIMLSLSYLMWPLQILLILPFIKLGEFIFSVHAPNHTVEEIIHSFQTGFFNTISHLSFELLCGLGAWFLIAVPVAVGIYLLMLLVLKVAFRRTNVE